MNFCCKCGAQFWEYSQWTVPVCTTCRKFTGSYQSSPYVYKCPCGGEFTYPTAKIGGYYCPFCNKKMEGM